MRKCTVLVTLIIMAFAAAVFLAGCLQPFLEDEEIKDVTVAAGERGESSPPSAAKELKVLPARVAYSKNEKIDLAELGIKKRLDDGSWADLGADDGLSLLAHYEGEDRSRAASAVSDFDPTEIEFFEPGDYTITVSAAGYGADIIVTFMVYVDRLPQAAPGNKALIVMPKPGKIVYDKDEFLNPADDLDVYWRDVYGIATELNYDARSSSPFSVELSRGTVSWDSVAGRVIQLTQAGPVTVTVRADTAHDGKFAVYNIVVNPEGELSLFVGSAITAYLPGEEFVPAAVYRIDNAGSTARVPDNELEWAILAPGEVVPTPVYTSVDRSDYTFTAGGAYTVSVTAGNEDTSYTVVVRTDADAEDFGGAAFTAYSVDHYGDGSWDTNSWLWAVDQINAKDAGTPGKEKNFVINLTGDVDLSGSYNDGYTPTFTKAYHRVSLRGDKEIRLGTGSGSILSIEANQTVILRGPALTGKSDNTYPVVSASGGAFVMRSGAVKDNGGGGVYVPPGGTFTMYGGIISGNNANLGGGVYVSSMANYGNLAFTMYGGTISGNTANDGGGVYVGGGFTMYGGTISGNTIDNGGGEGFGSGVVVGGEFRMLGGTISGNTNGGGVTFSSSGYTITTFRMLGGSIRGNGSYAVYGANNTVLYAGEIKDNYTGGIYQSNNGSQSSFRLYGGSGSYESADGAVQSGGIVIQGNGMPNGTLSNVKLVGIGIEYNGAAVDPLFGVPGIGLTNVITGTAGDPVMGIPVTGTVDGGWMY